MKKFKYALWILVAAFFGVIIAQNWDYVMTENILKLNLIIYDKPIPPLTYGAIIAICVGVGVLIMMMFYFSSRYEIYRAKRTIKALRSGMEESQKSISELQHEVELLKGGSPAPLNDMTESEGTVEPESETTQETQS